ncbi:MAG: proline racemase family protein [Planctomycetota bacterium]|nr:proline racemase family protein [Planctomycetota bacterium]
MDSHTEGEPTRVVVSGGPRLEGATVAEKAADLRTRFDDFRRAVVCEPRGHEALVGALLVEPEREGSETGVIFFNNVGTLHMCVHGTIGVMVTLARLGRVQRGSYTLDTPVGPVLAHLGENGLVSVENVPSFRQQRDVVVDIEGIGPVTGDVAWGGNWFFIVDDHGMELATTDLEALREYALQIRRGLEAAAIHGVHEDPGTGERTYHVIDHVELFDEPGRSDCDSRNFVLCPGGEYDRSPCGTGLSAKLACLAEDGMLGNGQPWAQESIIGSRFVGRYRELEERPGVVVPTITGGAWITGNCELHLDPADPFVHGIVRS